MKGSRLLGSKVEDRLRVRADTHTHPTFEYTRILHTNNRKGSMSKAARLAVEEQAMWRVLEMCQGPGKPSAAAVTRVLDGCSVTLLEANCKLATLYHATWLACSPKLCATDRLIVACRTLEKERAAASDGSVRKPWSWQKAELQVLRAAVVRFVQRVLRQDLHPRGVPLETLIDRLFTRKFVGKVEATMDEVQVVHFLRDTPAYRELDALLQTVRDVVDSKVLTHLMYWPGCHQVMPVWVMETVTAELIAPWHVAGTPWHPARGFRDTFCAYLAGVLCCRLGLTWGDPTLRRFLQVVPKKYLDYHSAVLFVLTLAAESMPCLQQVVSLVGGCRAFVQCFDKVAKHHVGFATAQDTRWGRRRWLATYCMEIADKRLQHCMELYERDLFYCARCLEYIGSHEKDFMRAMMGAGLWSALVPLVQGMDTTMNITCCGVLDATLKLYASTWEMVLDTRPMVRALHDKDIKCHYWDHRTNQVLMTSPCFWTDAGKRQVTHDHMLAMCPQGRRWAGAKPWLSCVVL